MTLKERIKNMIDDDYGSYHFNNSNHRNDALMLVTCLVRHKVECGFTVVGITKNPPFSTMRDEYGIMFEDAETFDKFWCHISKYQIEEIIKEGNEG